MKKFKIILGAVALAMGVGSASAATLGELFDGGSITVGDKVFSGWASDHYISSDGIDFDYSKIVVTELLDDGIHGLGLNFNVLDGALSVTGDGIFAFKDLMFSFDVTVLDSTLGINGNLLGINSGFVTNSGDNGFYIRETIAGLAGDLATASAEFSFLDPSLDGPGLIDDTTDSTIFSPQGQIRATKNILVWATGENESAGMFGFQQRFSQTTIDVPEPATITLLGLGFAGLAFRRRKLDA